MALKIGVYVPCAPDHAPTTKLIMYGFKMEACFRITLGADGKCVRSL